MSLEVEQLTNNVASGTQTEQLVSFGAAAQEFENEIAARQNAARQTQDSQGIQLAGTARFGRTPVPPMVIPGTKENKNATEPIARAMNWVWQSIAGDSSTSKSIEQQETFPDKSGPGLPPILPGNSTDTKQTPQEGLVPPAVYPGAEVKPGSTVPDVNIPIALPSESKPDGVPPGTIPIDQAKKKFGLDKDDVHAIKDGIGAGPKDWVGIDPQGNVWTGNENNKGENNGPYDVYLP